jgi:PAS domain S-box-containing protein
MHHVVPHHRPDGGTITPDTLHQALWSEEGLLETLPVAVYTCDAEGTITHYNRRAAEFWGRAPQIGDKDERFCGAFRLFLSDGTVLAHADTPMAHTLLTAQPQHNKEVWIERPDGTRMAALVNINPLLDENGRLIGAVNCFQDITLRKRTEDALQRREAELTDFFENGAIAMHWVGPDGIILRVNRAELAMLGYTEKEVVGRHISEFHADQDAIADILRKLADGEALHNYEAQLICKDSSIREVAISSSVFWEDDRFVHTRCFTLDITQQKRAEKLLRSNEQRLRQLLGAIPAAIYTTDAEGRIISYNQTATELWGCCPRLGEDSWCGSWRLYWPDGTPMPHDQCPMAVALKEERPIRSVEAVLEKPDGERVPFLAYPTPLKDDDGKLVGAINMMVDISKHKRAQEALHASEEFSRSILRASRDCIKVLDLDARLLSINECGRSYLEVEDVSAILNTSYFEFWSGEDRFAAERAVERAQEGRVGRFTAHYRTPSGKDSWWDEIVTPILSPSGKPERLLVISREITEAKRAEEQRELLIAELNHRVKNTLATVQSIAVHSLRNGGVSDSVAAVFEGRLLALSRAHDHLSSAGWKSADFGSILSDVLQPFGSGKADRVQLRGPSVHVPAGAAVALTMIFHELATNAAKYGALSADTGYLTVRWKMAIGANPTLRLSWRECGGPAVERPARMGFGRRLLERTIAQQLNGRAKLRFAPPGFRCILEVPIPADQRA